jgi:hypothetical protein
MFHFTTRIISGRIGSGSLYFFSLPLRVRQQQLSLGGEHVRKEKRVSALLNGELCLSSPLKEIIADIRTAPEISLTHILLEVALMPLLEIKSLLKLDFFGLFYDRRFRRTRERVVEGACMIGRISEILGQKHKADLLLYDYLGFNSSIFIAACQPVWSPVLTKPVTGISAPPSTSLRMLSSIR